jgi:hypothetical protein
MKRQFDRGSKVAENPQNVSPARSPSAPTQSYRLLHGLLESIVGSSRDEPKE